MSDQPTSEAGATHILGSWNNTSDIMNSEISLGDSAEMLYSFRFDYDN
jgi:hypothetical protein